MKKEALYTLLAFMLVVIFGACHQSHKKELDLAYALVESNPDSALVFLSHINQDKLSEEEMAVCPCLLYGAGQNWQGC